MFLNKKREVHGFGKHPLYQTWYGMMRRCYHPNDKRFYLYGARGIGVCEEWRDIGTFIRDMSPKPKNTTLDRIDSNRGYSPENCRWASLRTQANNKRSNKYVSFKGETHTLAEWCRKLELNYSTIQNRINIYGYTIEDAFTKKIEHKYASKRNN